MLVRILPYAYSPSKLRWWEKCKIIIKITIIIIIIIKVEWLHWQLGHITFDNTTESIHCKCKGDEQRKDFFSRPKTQQKCWNSIAPSEAFWWSQKSSIKITTSFTSWAYAVKYKCPVNYGGDYIKSNYTKSNHKLWNVGFPGEGKTGEKPLAAD